MEEKSEPVDPFKNAIEHVVVRHFLYPDDAETSSDYIKNLVDCDDEVSDPNIDALKREIGDACQFRVKMELASGSGHDEDQKKQRRHSRCVSSSVRSSRKMIWKALQFANARSKVMSTSVTFKLVSRNVYGLLSISVLFTSVNFDPVNTLDDSPLSDPDLVTNGDGSSSRFYDQVDDPAHVHNDNGPSSPLPDQVDNASCKTLSLTDPAPNGDVVGVVVDSVVAIEYRSPDGRIIDVLAHINGEDDIEEFGDAAQNGY
ncbi:hypothetical protein K7X08_007174 [Anisodus acutangulus]|uniref:Uncharacterized protein n=1 Tax=Anisodus acutangulus TaxID=402998 RepID=A0A9Q1LC54_9SOLA|nr:hypothetical protein K7X08_007174 [Anisodus acutangulus]